MTIIKLEGPPDPHLVYRWMFDYACERQMLKILPALMDAMGEENLKHAAPGCPGNTSALRYMTTILQGATHSYRPQHYEHVVSILQALHQTIPHVVPFKHYAKVLSGFKILTLMDMLKKRNRLILPRLNEYFPRTGFKHPYADQALEKNLTHALLKFRKFFLSLVASERLRKQYILQDCEEEYGSEFRSKLILRLKGLLAKVDCLIPPSCITCMMEKDNPAVYEVCGLTRFIQMVREKELDENDITGILADMKNSYSVPCRLFVSPNCAKPTADTDSDQTILGCEDKGQQSSHLSRPDKNLSPAKAPRSGKTLSDLNRSSFSTSKHAKSKQPKTDNENLEVIVSSDVESESEGGSSISQPSSKVTRKGRAVVPELGNFLVPQSRKCVVKVFKKASPMTYFTRNNSGRKVSHTVDLWL